MPPWQPKSDRVPSFRPLSPNQPASSFNITAPDISTPNLSAVQPRSDSPTTQRPRSGRPSSAARMSEWLIIQRNRLSSFSHRGDSHDDMNVQLWNHSRAERGLLSWEYPSKDPDAFEKVHRHPDPHPGTDSVQPPPIGRPRLEAPRLGRGFIKSASSLYSDLDLSPPEMVDRKSWQAESPVFGLNGIVRPSTGKSGVRSQDSETIGDPNRRSDISDLFRKQEELDNSIAALKLLENSAGPPNSPSSSKHSGEPSATRSDFSLSNFPDPPWVVDSPDSDNFAEPQRSPSPTPTVQPSRFNPLSVSIDVDNVPFDLVAPRMPASMMEHNRTLSLPVSETAESEGLVSARPPRFDSQGTQYDVTSFIGSAFIFIF